MTTLFRPKYVYQDCVIMQHKCYVSHGIAYTIDGKLAHNILVSNVPKELTPLKLMKYFRAFGEVFDVMNTPMANEAAIIFTEADSASRVLLKTEHVLDGFTLEISPHDNSTRLIDDMKSNREQLFDDTDALFNKNNILSLHSECLEHVLSFLEITDQLRFASVCPTFRNVFKSYAKRTYKKTFDMVKLSSLGTSHLHEFLYITSEFNTSLLFRGNVSPEQQNRILCAMHQACPNLTRLHLRIPYMNDEALREVTFLKYLKLLDLNGASETTVNLTGKYFDQLQNLSTLYIRNCTNIKQRNMLLLSKSIYKNLRTIDIRGCPQLKKQFFDCLVQWGENLWQILLSIQTDPYEQIFLLPRLKCIYLNSEYTEDEIDASYFYKLAKLKGHQMEILRLDTPSCLTKKHLFHIAELGKLKRLEVSRNPAVDDDVMQEFCKLKCLENLDILGCGNVNNAALTKLVESCPQLRHINIRYCRRLTCKFVFDSIPILRSSGRKLKITVQSSHLEIASMFYCQTCVEGEIEKLLQIERLEPKPDVYAKYYEFETDELDKIVKEYCH
ncbi:unnamed protein product [Ceratitis capitata]|uniref:(Mediterranean fruit fly) hypothetical protein n=1 Tax=Ceratitis capitata TaxID=7213 RepID=A0A811UWE2_CERCA|nr:unnamed protein product [Ceratitis capitata]